MVGSAGRGVVARRAARGGIEARRPGPEGAPRSAQADPGPGLAATQALTTRLPPSVVERLAGAVGNREVARLVTPGLQRRTLADPTSPVDVAEGARGPAVEELQQHLNRHGAAPRLQVDGIFGPKTKAALGAFQSSHTGVDGQPLTAGGGGVAEALSSIPGSSLLGLDRDRPGVAGARTWRALQQSPPSAPPAGGGAPPRTELTAILAKGAAMTAAEAARAKDLLFALEDDEFRAVLRQAAASGAFLEMLKNLGLKGIADTLGGVVQEVVVNTTLLKPAANTIADDFKRANEIYNPHGIEIEQGTHIDLSEKATRTLLGADRSLDEFDTTVTPMSATGEELKLVEMNRAKGRITGYWIPRMTSSRGEALDKGSLPNLGDERESVVVNTASRAQDTFPHELGHALGLGHDPGATNLMGEGKIRQTSGPGIDQLTPAQLATIRSSVFAEFGRKGVGT